MSKSLSYLFTFSAIFVLIAFISGCPGKLAPTPPATNTISNSEVAEAVASGAVTSTGTGLTEARYIPKNPKAVALAKVIESYLTLMPKAEAAVSQGLCASVQAGNSITLAANSVCGLGSNLTGAQNTAVTLTWAPCNGATPLGTWSGGVNLVLTASPGGTVFTCDNTFLGFQNGDVVTRSFLSPSGRINNFNLDPVTGQPWNPLTMQDLVTPNSPVTVLVDTYGAAQIPLGSSFTSLPANYPTNGYSGYASQVPNVGETITYGGPIARSITVNGLHVKADIGGYITWDYTISTAFPGQPTSAITVDAGNHITGGILYVQDNIKQITTSSVFAGVGYSGVCGVPTAGTVTTDVVPGFGSYAHEVLTFSGSCGTASLNGPNTYLFHSF